MPSCNYFYRVLPSLTEFNQVILVSNSFRFGSHLTDRFDYHRLLSMQRFTTPAMVAVPSAAGPISDERFTIDNRPERLSLSLSSLSLSLSLSL